MVKTVLYAEKLYDNDKVEREVFGPDVRVVWRNVANLSQLEERDCAELDSLMVMRHAVTAEHLAKFPSSPVSCAWVSATTKSTARRPMHAR